MYGETAPKTSVEGVYTTHTKERIQPKTQGRTEVGKIHRDFKSKHFGSVNLLWYRSGCWTPSHNEFWLFSDLNLRLTQILSTKGQGDGVNKGIQLLFPVRRHRSSRKDHNKLIKCTCVRYYWGLSRRVSTSNSLVAVVHKSSPEFTRAEVCDRNISVFKGRLIHPEYLRWTQIWNEKRSEHCQLILTLVIEETFKWGEHENLK